MTMTTERLGNSRSIRLGLPVYVIHISNTPNARKLPDKMVLRRKETFETTPNVSLSLNSLGSVPSRASTGRNVPFRDNMTGCRIIFIFCMTDYDGPGDPIGCVAFAPGPG